MEQLTYRYAMLIFSALNITSIPTAVLYYYIGCECKDQRAVDKEMVGAKENGSNKEELPEENEGNDKACSSNDGESSFEIEADGKQTKGMSEKTDNSIIKSHMHVLKDPVFITILAYFLIGGTGESGFHTFPVNFAVHFEILTLPEAALGITLTGVATCVGCLFVVVISYWNYDKFSLAVVSMLLIGGSLVAVGFARSKWSMYITFIAYGLMDGAWISNVAPWIATYFDEPEFLTVRMSYVFFFNGLSSLLGPLTGGYFIEGVGFKFVCFYYGATSLCGALILSPCLVKARILRQ